MRKFIHQTCVILTGIAAALVIPSCQAPESETAEKPIISVEILKNGIPIPDTVNGYPVFSVPEEKSVILGVKLNPNVKAGIHWQSSRNIVEMNQLNGPEITLFARYGGETTIFVRTQNTYNEAPVYSQVKVNVIPSSYYKWDYKLDGWKDLPALKPVTIDRIYNKMLVRSGNTPINEDAQRGGFVMEGPATLVIGSVMPSPTNSVYGEDPLFDESALFNFTKLPSDKSTAVVQPPYTLKIRISVEYEILSDPAPRQGLRLQVNNNTEERDKAAVLVNWLAAEYTAASGRSGTLTGIFDTARAEFEPNLDPERKDRVPGSPAIAPGSDSVEVQEVKRLRKVLSNSFVCLSLPDGKVLIRSIRIETAD